MAAAPRTYLPAAVAEARLAAWLEGGCTTEQFLFNNMEEVVFAKFLVYPVLLDALRGDFGLAARMSGSGSACFALLPADTPVQAVVVRIREFLGAAAFVTEAKIL
jgi:4-diphosphocytidyl-2-C-methyl-D-erythritol kinase